MMIKAKLRLYCSSNCRGSVVAASAQESGRYSLTVLPANSVRGVDRPWQRRKPGSARTRRCRAGSAVVSRSKRVANSGVPSPCSQALKSNGGCWRNASTSAAGSSAKAWRGGVSVSAPGRRAVLPSQSSGRVMFDILDRHGGMAPAYQARFGMACAGSTAVASFRIVIQPRRQPALGIGLAPVLAPCVVGDLVACDASDHEVLAVRVREVPA